MVKVISFFAISQSHTHFSLVLHLYKISKPARASVPQLVDLIRNHSSLHIFIWVNIVTQTFRRNCSFPEFVKEEASCLELYKTSCLVTDCLDQWLLWDNSRCVWYPYDPCWLCNRMIPQVTSVRGKKALRLSTAWKEIPWNSKTWGLLCYYGVIFTFGLTLHLVGRVIIGMFVQENILQQILQI